MSARIFEFTDYCKYLNAWLEHKKLENPHFSYQQLAAKLGLGSKVQVYRILNGKRKHLGPELIERWNLLLGHSRMESEYFRHMVSLQESRDPLAQAQYSRVLGALRNRLRPKSLEKIHYEYFREWYMPVLRELFCQVPVSTSFQGIASLLSPSISTAQVQAALDVMLKLGILVKEGDGYKQANTRIHASESLRQKAITAFQTDMMKLGIDAMRIPGKHATRFTTTTMGVPRFLLPVLMEKIRQFQNEIANLVSTQSDFDQVFQLNLQLFPLSNPMQEIPK